MLSEFDLISRYFSWPQSQCPGLRVGNGDDAAVLAPEGEVVITTDTLNEGVHFFPSVDPANLGYRSLQVNLSDLAAMGARPWCFTLSLTLPESDEHFLEAFSAGLGACAADYGITLVGGNTTRGPLAITIGAYGLLSEGIQPLLRSRAREGDLLFVTGKLGLSALYVMAGYGKLTVDREILAQWESESYHSRVYCAFACEVARLGLSECAIDLSDGIAGDLGQILRASSCGAELWLESLPVSDRLDCLKSEEERLELAACGGGDYQLLFAVPPRHRQEFQALASRHGVPVTQVGIITKNAYRVLKHGTICPLKNGGFDHFSEKTGPSLRI